MSEAHSTYSSQIMDRFGESVTALKKQSKLSTGITPFIWAIAVLLIVIFAALYINVRTNNETILRTNIMKSTTQVANNIELRLTSTSSTMARVIEKLEQEGPSKEVFDKYGREFLLQNPEVILLRLIEPNGKGITALVGPRIRNESFRQYNYLDYPPVVRDSIRDAFATKRVVYSSYWEIPYDSTSPNTVIIYPFTLNEKEYALLARISLSRLLEESVPNILRSDYEFSLMHGTELIAGKALYNPPDDFTIPSYIRSADPLPSSIQLYGCNLVESPLIFASPFLFWLGSLMLFLLLLLFFLYKKMVQNQNALDAATKEVELRRSIERSMLMGVLITDMNSTIIYLNQSMCNLCGYSENELLGKESPYPFWGDSTPLPSTILSAKDLNASELPYRFDITIRKKNSQKIKGMLLASPFYSQDGEQSGWIYLIRDNTNDFNSQTLINDAIASYEKLLNSVNSCISVVTHKPSGNILGMRNDLYVETMGSTVKGHQDISRSFHEPFNAEGKRTGDIWVSSMEKWFNVSESRITLPGGSHVTLQTAQDITDKKISEKTLEEQTNKMEISSRLITLGEMASTITHEINQPLTAIVAYTSTAIEVMDNASEVNKKQVIEVFQKVSAQATRIDKIIKNIRSFAKRRSTSLEPILLGNVLNDTMELGKLIEKKYNGVRLNYEVPKTLPTVMCDPVQVVQILLNLIRNAADACTEAKSPNLEITVRVTKEEDHVAIAVEDHGPGINDTMKASLFTPFFSTKKNGLGLGLSTCQTIAEAHNTRLEVRDNPGGGTIFSFELKIVANN